jgi:hypothetical protein
MKVIGLAGRSGVGKSTLSATYLRPLGFMEVALADEIKIRAIATGVATYEEVFVGSKPPHVRTWLQEEGTERGRQVFGEDVWVRALFARLRKVSETWGVDRFVVTDVRFVNESNFIRSQGGLVLRVDAPGRNRGNGMTEEQRLHPSEVDLDRLTDNDFDGLVLNDTEYETTVGWQLHAHLYLRRFITQEYKGPKLTVQDKYRLLQSILPPASRA